MSASASTASAPAGARAATVAPGAALAASASSTGPHPTMRALECGLGLLRLFTAERPVWGITEMARELNVDRATAHRYATTCLELGYLEQLLTREYRLTRRCAEPGLAVLGALELMRSACPILRELRRQTARTVSLAILNDDEVLYLQRLRGFAHGSYQLERGLGAGSRVPARDTAAGRALLADLARGLTVDESDACAGARGLAITVCAPGERTSAIEITVPAESISAAGLCAELGEPLLTARAVLEAALGAALEGVQSEERVA